MSRRWASPRKRARWWYEKWGYYRSVRKPFPPRYRRLYIEAAKAARPFWQPIRFISTVHRGCEHCFRKVPVALVKPGLLASTGIGDWVCARCLPIVGDKLIEWALEEVVLGDSA